MTVNIEHKLLLLQKVNMWKKRVQEWAILANVFDAIYSYI